MQFGLVYNSQLLHTNSRPFLHIRDGLDNDAPGSGWGHFL